MTTSNKTSLRTILESIKEYADDLLELEGDLDVSLEDQDSELREIEERLDFLYGEACEKAEDELNGVETVLEAKREYNIRTFDIDTVATLCRHGKAHNEKCDGCAPNVGDDL